MDPTLFDDLRPSARNSDPDTSHAAAHAVTRQAQSALHSAILEALQVYGPQNDEGIAYLLAEHYPEVMSSPSGIRSRRSELVRLGLVVDTGTMLPTARGRASVVWQAVGRATNS